MSNIPAHIERLRENVEEVKRLVSIHEQLTGNGPGRRRNVQVLNKSAVLLVVATWESFVETLAVAASDFLIERSANHAAIPSEVLACASARLKADKHDNAVWSLAGNGWKTELKKEALERTRRLNTPTASNIDALFRSVVGIPDISSHWHWKGSTHAQCIRRLRELLDRRHEVAHGAADARTVTKKYVIDSNLFVIRLAAISSNRVRSHIQGITGRYPWAGFVKGTAR